jgi:hypothetical protein
LSERGESLKEIPQGAPLSLFGAIVFPDLSGGFVCFLREFTKPAKE